jgi:hypothetical protein
MAFGRVVEHEIFRSMQRQSGADQLVGKPATLRNASVAGALWKIGSGERPIRRFLRRIASQNSAAERATA